MYDMLHQLDKLPTAAILSFANIPDSYQALIAEEGAAPLIMIATMEPPHLVLVLGSHTVLTVAVEDSLPHFLSVLRLYIQLVGAFFDVISLNNQTTMPNMHKNVVSLLILIPLHLD